MTRTLTHQTTLTVYLVIQDDTGSLAFSIYLVTRLFSLLWQASQFVCSGGYELMMLFSEVRAAIDFTGKVLAIGLSALAYGLGVGK